MRDNIRDNIVKGYYGIMDLDLTNIDPKFRDDAVKQHYQDIKNYQIEQKQLKPHLRYENTIGRIKNMHEIDEKFAKKRKEKHDIEQLIRNNIYNEAKNKYTNNLNP